MPRYEMSLSCLGAMIWYLKRCSLDVELLSLSRFTEYVPVDCMTTQEKTASADRFPQPDQQMVSLRLEGGEKGIGSGERENMSGGRVRRMERDKKMGREKK